MDLIDRIKKIAETEGIPQSKIILDEAGWFFEEHRYHGAHQIILEIEKGKVLSINLYCTAGDLVRTKICSHQGSGEFESFPSIVYCIHKMTDVMKYQKRRRSGKEA